MVAWSSRTVACFFFQAEAGIRDLTVTGVQTCALPIYQRSGWNMPVERIAGTGLYRTDIPLDALTGADRRRIRRALERLAVAHLAPRPLLSLSYGERRGVPLAGGAGSRSPAAVAGRVAHRTGWEKRPARVGRVPAPPS